MMALKIYQLFCRRNSEKTYKFNLPLIKHRIGNIEKRLSDSKAIKKNINYLKELIDLCEKQEVKPIIVLPPYHTDFYENGGIAYKNKIDSLLKPLLERKNLFLIDGNSLKIKNFIYYKDVDHLNNDGALFFTKKIDSIISKLIY